MVRPRTFIWITLMDGRGPSTCGIFHYFSQSFTAESWIRGGAARTWTSTHIGMVSQVTISPTVSQCWHSQLIFIRECNLLKRRFYCFWKSLLIQLTWAAHSAQLSSFLWFLPYRALRTPAPSACLSVPQTNKYKINSISISIILPSNQFRPLCILYFSII